MRAISPKWSPGPRVPRGSPATVTSASPSSITKKPTPPVPSSVTVLPAGNVRSVIALTTLRSCLPSSSEKSGTCLSRSAEAATPELYAMEERRAFGREVDVVAPGEAPRRDEHVLEVGVGMGRVVVEHQDACRLGRPHQLGERGERRMPPAAAGRVLGVG